MSEDRILFLPDIHTPHNIPLENVWRFTEDFKPTVIILGGDVSDWESVCHWVADQSRILKGGTIKQNYEDLKKIVLDPLRKAAPKAETILLEGNHERWLRMAAEMNPNGEEYWGLRDNLPAYIKIYKENVPYKASDHLYYIHGLYTNIYHARKTVEAFHKTILYGHVHDVQRYTAVSPIDVDQYYTGASCGCLCNMNPYYMRNRPNRWTNGFNFCYVDKKTGEFSETQVYIIKNRFWANGRRYV
jgi:3',5'-cyclic AMP phosphodiesterase CpdA